VVEAVPNAEALNREDLPPPEVQPVLQLCLQGCSNRD